MVLECPTFVEGMCCHGSGVHFLVMISEVHPSLLLIPNVGRPLLFYYASNVQPWMCVEVVEPRMSSSSGGNGFVIS